ncbi:phosphate transport system protein [Rhodoligotrophos appendicifer]|uniref:phosphate signaling complex protein PhoU n=1 Tax=Rhodoligotrophos appendicifer TaxID=987056 RepID=UPI00117ED024|nr:phosphate signaling complex protein PhoU [Rhodoligotrophos appendicifer]
MSEHIVKSFDEEIAAFNTRLAQMGGLAEEQLAGAIDALEKRDVERASEIIKRDQKLDDLEHQVEERSILLIAKRQPMARDLRHVVVGLRTAMDLERIGDLAKNIAKRSFAISDGRPTSGYSGINQMGRLALEQLKLVLDALVQHDADKAMEVWRSDEAIDSLYNALFRELLTYMMEDPRTIGSCTHLLFAAKNIERIGDHCTNIAENVYYLVHGQTLNDDRPKSDTTSMTNIRYAGNGNKTSVDQ